MDFVVMLRGILFFVCLLGTEGRPFVRLCYYSSWAYTRASRFARCDIQDIDASLCTHMVYAFVNIDKDTRQLVPASPADEDQPDTAGRFKLFNNMKKSYPNLKTLASVGGQNVGSEAFLAITRNKHYLDNFVASTISFLRLRNFDGLDVDWEFPNATTKADFTRLLEALSKGFEEDTSGKERLLLTAALSPGKERIDAGYDIGALNHFLDFASLMTYDYHGTWNAITSFDSPLYSRLSDKQFGNTYSTNWTVSYFKAKGLQADKILVGITAAGTHFKLQNDTLHGVGAPAVLHGGAQQSELWQIDNKYAYPEICRVLQSTHAHREFDLEQRVPFAYRGDDWFGYEDPQSLTGKVDWMVKQGVAGAMFWTVDMDDFSGKFCDKGKFPLLHALSHSARQISGTHLTDNVNPNIRYLTMFLGDGCAGLQAAVTCVVLSVFLGLLLVRR